MDPALDLNPAPWRVGDRPTERSMWPIRDGRGKIVAYAPGRAIADLIVRMRGGASTLPAPTLPNPSRGLTTGKPPA